MSTVVHVHTLNLKKMCHRIVTIMSSNLNRFSKLFHCWKVATKQCITLPTTPKCVATLP